MDLGSMVKSYGAIGAGGLALVVLLWLLVYLVKKINPLLDQIQSDNQAHKEVIKNNTDAIKEVSRSNHNVAQALSLLDNSFSSFAKIMDKHDERAQVMQQDIVRISENVKKD